MSDPNTKPILSQDSKKPKKKESRRQRKNGKKKIRFNKKELVEISLYSLFVFTLVCIAFLGRQPIGPQILLNQPAPERVVAEFPFVYESTLIREEQIRTLRDQVPPVFKRSNIPFEAFKNSLTDLQDRIAKTTIEFEDGEKEALENEFKKTIADWLDKSQINADSVSIYEFTIRTNPRERSALFKDALEILSKLYSDGVYTAKTDELSGEKMSVIQIFAETGNAGLPKARSKSNAEIALRREIDSLSRNDKTTRTLFNIFQAGLKANLIYSETDTASAIDRAIEKIEPAIFTYRQGDTLIEPAEVIDAIDIERMEMYEAARLASGNDPLFFNRLFLERLVLATFLMISLGLFLKQGLRNRLKRSRTLAIIAVSLILNLLLIRVVLELGEVIAINNRGVLSVLPYIAPCALAPILVAALIGMVPAVFTALVIAMFFGITQGNSIDFALITLFSGVVGAYYSNNIRSRTKLVRAGILTGLAAAIAAMLSGILSNLTAGLITEQIFISLLIGVLSGIVSVGLLPLLENLFKVTTDITLLELTDFNHPLLRRMQIEAPGTYHHSLMVANLAENAAAKIGASPLLCRVCCLFHDIGKLVKPEYFAENQRGGLNPHDAKNPSMSALVIKAHVKEGVELAKSHKLPRVIEDVIRQHHGTTLIQYFFHQANEQLRTDKETQSSQRETNSEVDQSTYRYDGPRPAFKESAIIFFADGVEAASRSLRKVTQSNIEDLIDKIFRDKIEDGQLNDCPLTFQELNKIRESFVYTLLNMLHSRIEYPKDSSKEEAPSNAT